MQSVYLAAALMVLGALLITLRLYWQQRLIA
jgi:hypothetical protein